ncbi:MAG: response regulator transcription factor [Anaerolineales bacterium]|jgi:DNA-binding response OmpR family regulator|nr:response regulator transcription factor [Anaerolineales bacterium]
MPETILVVEDEPALQETLVYNLEKEGYIVKSTADGRNALETARKLNPDLIVLDIMLPSMDGIEVCKTLRRESFNSPILMLTARDDEIDRVVGLEIGTDDYITKPFSMRELLARVKAQLRRTRVLREDLDKIKTTDQTRDIATFGNLTINQTRREVLLDQTIMALKPQEYDLLLFFAEHRGKMLTREFILERVWGWDYIGDSRTVDVHVRWLRQKIEKEAAKPTRIVTVRGGGYRFEG